MKKLVLASTILMGLLGASAMATEAPKWGQVGPWRIAVDQTLGNGCFMMAGYNNTSFRVGINNTRNESYFMIANPAWQTLVVGQQYQLAGQFDNGTIVTWTGTAGQLSTATGSVTYLEVTFNTPAPAQVMQVFGQRWNFKLYYRGNLLADLNLKGTEAAVASLLNCNQQFTAGAGDPFANGSGTRVADPFRN